MLTDTLTARIAELSAHQAEIQARADKEKAAVQEQINALVDAMSLLEKNPELETVFLRLSALKLIGE